MIGAMEPEAVRVIVVRDDKLLLMRRNKFGKEYYTLIGGHIEPGEDPQTAMLREVDEETGLQLGSPKMVYIQQPVGQYNKQYIFTADYAGGEIAMRPDADEVALSQQGNVYEPLWVRIEEVAALPFLPPELSQRVLHDITHGFPDEPQIITPQGESV